MNYLLTGSESYRLNERKKQIIKDTIGKDNDMAISVYNDIEGLSVEAVIDDCTMLSFFTEKKVVIYENPRFIKVKKQQEKKDQNTDKDETVNNELEIYSEKKESSENEKAITKLLDYLSQPNDATTLIIVVDKDLGKNAVFSRLSKVMLHEEFAKVKQEEFQIIVRSDLQKRNIRLDNASLKELFNRLPLDIENWKRELEKLTLYPEKITVAVIKEIVTKPLEDDVFQLSNAVIKRNLSLALSIYHDLLVNDKYVSIPLIGLLAGQFRFMCQCKILQEHRYSLNEIASELNNVNAYRVQITLENSAYNTSKDYLKLLNDLSDLDQKVKTGRIDAVTGVELFIINAVRS